MASLRINVLNILEVEPGPIRCLTLNENTLKLALFRGGKYPSIEIWDVSHIPFKERVITQLENVEDQASVENLVWIKDRLFSCGLHGFIVEHNLTSLSIKGKTAATSGPVWCMSSNSEQTHLAAGTEDGFVNIFEILDEGLMYIKVLDRQEGRVLCLSWSPCGKYIATGSADSIRLWDVEKGHALQRLLTGRSKKTETIVWSIIMLEDFMIATGDSRGIVSFWDGRVGILRYKMYTHKADILTLKLSTDKSTIYAAGVDPLVVLLTRSSRSSDRWFKSHQRVLHTNDVMCVASHGNRLFSAGIDSNLVISSFPPKVITKYPQIPFERWISYSRNSSQILIQTPTGLEIWQLPSQMNKFVTLQKLVEFRSHQNELVVSSAQSSCGKFFAYTTSSRTNIFKLSTTLQAVPEISKLKIRTQDDEKKIVGQFPFLHFLNNLKMLAISGDARTFLLYEIEDSTNSISVQILHYEKSLFKGILQKLDGIAISNVSSSGDFLAITNCSGDTFILNLDLLKLRVKLHSQPVSFRHQVTALAFHPYKWLLASTHLDYSLMIWNYDIHGLSCIRKITKRAELQPIIGMKWCPDGQSLIAHTIDQMFLAISDEEVPKKRARQSKKAKSLEVLKFNIKSGENKYPFMCWMDFKDSNELILIEHNPNSIVGKLPPSFAKKRFGM